MSAESNVVEQRPRKQKVVYKSGSSGAVYGFGLIGAWIYYIGHATTFWMGVLGILKGIVWPAMLVYEVLKTLGM